MGEPDPFGSQAEELLPIRRFQRQGLGKDPQVLPVSDPRRPQRIGEVAAPDAALRAMGIDHPQRGLVQIGAGIGLTGPGGDEIR